MDVVKGNRYVKFEENGVEMFMRVIWEDGSFYLGHVFLGDVMLKVYVLDDECEPCTREEFFDGSGFEIVKKERVAL